MNRLGYRQRWHRPSLGLSSTLSESKKKNNFECPSFYKLCARQQRQYTQRLFLSTNTLFVRVSVVLTTPHTKDKSFAYDATRTNTHTHKVSWERHTKTLPNCNKSPPTQERYCEILFTYFTDFLLFLCLSWQCFFWGIMTMWGKRKGGNPLSSLHTQPCIVRKTKEFAKNSFLSSTNARYLFMWGSFLHNTLLHGKISPHGLCSINVCSPY